jgi:uncharacterized membrane protein
MKKMTSKSLTTWRHRVMNRAWAYAPLALALTLSACASLSGGPEAQVRARADDRWQVLRAGEFDKAYAYSTTAFKAVVSPESYRQRFGGAVQWIGSKVTAVTCPEAGKCQVKLHIQARPLAVKFDTLETDIEETWLLEDGQWQVFQPLEVAQPKS